MHSGPKQALERQIAAGVVIAALVAALGTVAIDAVSARHRSETERDVNAVADALFDALRRGAPPQPLLDAFAGAGNIRAATVYGANGQRLAATGTPSPDAEQLFRSMPGGGSLSVEVAGGSGNLPMKAIALDALTAATLALVIGAAAAAALSRLMRRHVAAMRAGVDEAMRDQTYATRVAQQSGALAPLAAGINRMLEQMQQRDLVLRRRSTELETANKDLESFASTVAHDLRAPVGSISGFAQALDEDYAPQLDETGRECIHWIRHSARQMNELIEGMLQMARLTRIEVRRSAVDLTRLAREIATSLQHAHPERNVDFVIRDGIIASGDPQLLRSVLENLIGNAFKFTGKRDGARIEVGARAEEGATAYYVRDNGAGFAPEHAAKMFRPFQRLHSEKEFSGTGIGLATVHRIVQRHGGRVWAEGEPGKGATIYFTTGAAEELAA